MLAGHPLRPARDRRRPPRAPGLGGDPPDPLGHLRLRRQARAGRLQHRRHRQPDGRLLLAPPRARATRSSPRSLRSDPRPAGLDVGQRVVLNPWLTCGPRGIDPPCPPCQAGDLSLCWSFTKGDLGPGVHVGVITGRPGRLGRATGRARLHADPRPRRHLRRGRCAGRSLLGVLPRHRAPPAPALGACARLRRRRPGPDQRRHPDQPLPRRGGRRGGALRGPARDGPAVRGSAVFAHEPRLALVEALAEWSGAVLHMPLDGLPVAHPGHIDVVYDSIAKAETLEVGVRVLAERGRLVYTGVATPERWESTPIYFKEITIAGSNAFGMEDFEGRRQHAIAHYLAAGRRGPARHHPDADPPLRARGVVAGAQGAGAPGPQRRAEGGLYTQSRSIPDVGRISTVPKPRGGRQHGTE